MSDSPLFEDRAYDFYQAAIYHLRIAVVTYRVNSKRPHRRKWWFRLPFLNRNRVPKAESIEGLDRIGVLGVIVFSAASLEAAINIYGLRNDESRRRLKDLSVVGKWRQLTEDDPQVSIETDDIADIELIVELRNRIMHARPEAIDDLSQLKGRRLFFIGEATWCVDRVRQLQGKLDPNSNDKSLDASQCLGIKPERDCMLP